MSDISSGANAFPRHLRWIVIADDDDLVRTIWAEVLTGAGYRVLEAPSGKTALDLTSSVVPDLLILDLRMPGLSGEEVLQHLDRSPLLRTIPVLIVSGFLESDPHDGFGLNIVGTLPNRLGGWISWGRCTARYDPRLAATDR
jgi:CheY-like chemotaxis protein